MAVGMTRLKRLAVLAAVGGALVAGFARPVDAKPGLVKVKNGPTFQGDVDETTRPGYVIVKQPDGKVVQLNKSNLDGPVTYFNTPAEEFQARLANLGPQDVAGRIALARWALTQKEPDLAAQAVASVKQVQPANAEAAALDKQIAALRPPATAPASQPAATGPAPRPPASPAKRVLTADEVQLVRAREMQPDREKLRIQAHSTLKRKAMDAGLITAAEMRSMPVQELALLVLRKGTPELQKEVKIQADPVALAEYRTRINKAIVSGCATATCHGSPDGVGRLVLFPGTGGGAAAGEAADLTNFVVLQKYEGTGGGVPRSMIDRTSPLNSLLLGYLLPTKETRTPHPEVQGFKPIAKSPNDVTFVTVLNWMGKTLPAATPSYDDIDLSQDPKAAGDPPPADQPAGNPPAGNPPAANPPAGPAAGK